MSVANQNDEQRVQNDQHPVIEAFDPTVMLTRIGGDMPLFIELVQIFHEDYPSLIDEMRRAIVENDPSTLKRAAHTLRGAIGSFTTSQPYEMAKQLESMGQANTLDGAAAKVDAVAENITQLAIALKRSASC